MSRVFPFAAGLALLIVLAAGSQVALLLSRPPVPAVPIGTSSEAAADLTLLETPKTLPELRFVNQQGQSVSLADFRGKVVLLNIWATWCLPCREEMPTLERLQEELGGNEFEVIVLSIDQGGAAAVESFYQEIGIHRLGVYVDTSGKVARDLNIIGLPTTLLIDREGWERARLIGPAVWDSPEIVNVIKSVVASAPTTRSGLEWSPQHFDAQHASARSPYLLHANVKLSVNGDRLTFQ